MYMPTEPYQHNLQYWFAHSNMWSTTSSKISESSLNFEEITLTSIKRGLKDWSQITILYYFIDGENNKIWEYRNNTKMCKYLYPFYNNNKIYYMIIGGKQE